MTGYRMKVKFGVMKNLSLFILLALTCAICPGCSRGETAEAGRSRDIGLVLSSGGCKGAYHLGVWKALSEAGMTRRIGVISGTSVGALCSALFASVPDHESQLKAWKETTSVFRLAPDPADIRRIYEREADKKRKWYGVAELSQKLTNELWTAAERQARHEMMPRLAIACRELEENPDSTNLLFGAMSAEPIRRQLAAILPDPLPPEWPVVYATALKCGKKRTLKAFCLNKLDRNMQIDALCASAAIPVAFPPVKMDGSLWQDGSWVSRGGDTTPIGPILENHGGIKTLIVVYLHDDRNLPPGYRDGIRRKTDKAGVRLIEIVPTQNIGGPLNGWFGVFDFTPDTMRELVELGYRDARAALSGQGM